VSQSYPKVGKSATNHFRLFPTFIAEPAPNRKVGSKSQRVGNSPFPISSPNAPYLMGLHLNRSHSRNRHASDFVRVTFRAHHHACFRLRFGNAAFAPGAGS
jgi:hypothetical protein